MILSWPWPVVVVVVVVAAAAAAGASSILVLPPTVVLPPTLPPSQVWSSAKDQSKQELSAARSALGECSGQLSMCQGYCQQYEQQLAATQAQAEKWEAEREGRAAELEARLLLTVSQLGGLVGRLAAGMQALCRRLEAAAAEEDKLQAQLLEEQGEGQELGQRQLGQGGQGAAGLSSAGDAELVGLLAGAQQAEAAHQTLQARAREASFRHGAARGAVAAKRRQLEEYRQLAGGAGAAAGELALAAAGGGGSSSSSGLGSTSAGEGGDAHMHAASSSSSSPVCDRCLQPIDAALYAANQRRLATDVAAAEREQQEVEEALARLESERSVAAAATATAAQLVEDARGRQAQEAREVARRMQEAQLQWRQRQEALQGAQQQRQQLRGALEQAGQCRAATEEWLAALVRREDPIGREAAATAAAAAAAAAAAQEEAPEAPHAAGAEGAAAAALPSVLHLAKQARQASVELCRQYDVQAGQLNPHASAVEVLSQQAASAAAQAGALEARQGELEAEAEQWKQVRERGGFCGASLRWVLWGRRDCTARGGTSNCPVRGCRNARQLFVPLLPCWLWWPACALGSLCASASASDQSPHSRPLGVRRWTRPSGRPGSSTLCWRGCWGTSRWGGPAFFVFVIFYYY